MKKDIVIFGVGEFAMIANQYFKYDSDKNVVGFVAHQKYIKEKEIEGTPVFAYENIEKEFPASQVSAYVAIPSSSLNQSRKNIYNEMKAKGYSFASYVSSKAFCWRNAKIGENTFIFENNVIQPYAEIGNNVVMWSGNHIGHRTIIKDHVFMTSHVVVSGYCSIGEQSFLGVNATFNDKTGVADKCIVGSGSLVTKYLSEPESLYMGSPAKKVPGKNVFEIPL
jgi:sugar O-acyltransferase (sialic acid O-acetyltransferase NeuD family)